MTHLLLQKDTFTEDEAADTEVVIRRYFDVTIASDESVCLGRGLPHDYSGVFRGSLALAARLGKRFPWADALAWAPAFRQKLLSKNFFFLDADGILHASDFDFPCSWPLFIRPTSGTKTFSGGVFTKEQFEVEMRFLVNTRNGNPFTTCLVASPRAIKREWRTIFVNNQYSSGSQYMLSGEKVLSPYVPTAVVEFAAACANADYFQNIFDFTLDVAESDDGLCLLEVNGFETASFYAADLDKVYSDWAAALAGSEENLLP